MFELDLGAHELRKRGARVRLQDQPFRVLEALVEQPGEVVTREQLKDRLWAEDEFVEFDKSLNTAVQKIRQALSDSATSPRFLETVPKVGYRFIAPLQDAGPRREQQSGEPETPARRLWPAIPVVVGVVALFVMASVAMTWWMLREPLVNEQRVLRRLTTDSGLSAWPALSPNGDLFAYASDRAARGDLDIWVRQVSVGEPIRLTDDPADDYEPSFSPDGDQIAFRSERGQGGIYLIPSLGGEARLIAEGGRRPRYSPDGQWIAFWRGHPHGDSGKSFVIPAAGGSERPIQPGFFGVRDPTWSPDGKHILFAGFFETPTRESRHREWWVTPLDGGTPTPTGALELFRSQGFIFPSLGATPATSPADWTTQGVAFQAQLGDSTNVWQIRISPRDWQVQGRPEQLTSGAGHEVHSRQAPDGRMVLANLSLNDDIWGLPVASNEGKPKGELRRITNDLGSDRKPALSVDGKKMAFDSDRTGSREVWIQDLESGLQRQLTFDSEATISTPRISPSGQQVSYDVRGGTSRPIYVVPSSGGVGRKVCEDCGLVNDWHPNEKWILFEKSVTRPGGRDVALYLLDVSSGRQTRILYEPGRRFHETRFSPDGRWIATGGTNSRQILVAAFRGEQEIPSREWISVAEEAEQERHPVWSPDENLIYFLSDRDGFRCIYAQRLESLTKRPRGVPFVVQHFHQTARSLLQTNAGAILPSLRGDLLVFGMSQTLGNIWISEPPPHGEN